MNILNEPQFPAPNDSGFGGSVLEFVAHVNGWDIYRRVSPTPCTTYYVVEDTAQTAELVAEDSIESGKLYVLSSVAKSGHPAVDFVRAHYKLTQ